MVAAVMGVTSATGCASGGAQSTATTPAQSTSPDRSTGASSAAQVRFDGWDPHFGYGGHAFRTDLAIAPDGHVTGSLDFAWLTRRGLLARSFTVAGTAGPADARAERRRLRLELSRPLRGARVLRGYLAPRHIALHVDPRIAELTLSGSSLAVTAKYRARKRILGGRGGYDGWLRRQRMRQAAVHHVDMDGDGRRDLVAVVWSRLTDPRWGGGLRQVFVRLATGAATSVEVPGSDVVSSVGWVGSVQLPGFAGRQIVLRSAAGAANEFFDVVAARDGVLEVIKAPEPDDGWNEGGTVGTGTHGRFCRDGALHAWSSRGVVRQGALRRGATDAETIRLERKRLEVGRRLLGKGDRPPVSLVTPGSRERAVGLRLT